MVEGRTARRSTPGRRPNRSALAQDAEGVGVDGAHRSSCLKWREALRGGVDLDDLPPQQRRLHGQRGQEAVTAAVCSMFLSSWRVLCR